MKEEGTKTHDCPFPDCDWESRPYDPGRQADKTAREHAAELHYEREHAGRVRVLAAVEVERLMGPRDAQDVREAVMERLEDDGHEVAWVRSEVLQEPDDHEAAEKA